MTELLIRQVGGKHETIQDSRPPFIPFRENAFWAEEANLPPKKLDGSVYFSESEGGDPRGLVWQVRQMQR